MFYWCNKNNVMLSNDYRLFWIYFTKKKKRFLLCAWFDTCWWEWTSRSSYVEICVPCCVKAERGGRADGQLFRLQTSNAVHSWFQYMKMCFLLNVSLKSGSPKRPEILLCNMWILHVCFTNWQADAPFYTVLPQIMQFIFLCAKVGGCKFWHWNLPHLPSLLRVGRAPTPAAIFVPNWVAGLADQKQYSTWATNHKCDLSLLAVEGSLLPMFVLNCLIKSLWSRP